MKYCLLIFIITSCCFGYTQNTNDTAKSELYKNYREDQFYASITYNLLNNKPNSVSQNGFSTGFHFGFIRDMPINKRRNIAIGLGLGLSANSYNQNIRISSSNNEILYTIADNTTHVSKNKFSTYLVELPVEIRWRTSTPTEYNFWRIYSGFKLGHLLYNTTKFKSDSGNNKLYNIAGFNSLQYGLTLSIGYGTWNFNAYYGLNSIFNANAKLNGQSIDMKSFKIGLMFYIL